MSDLKKTLFLENPIHKNHIPDSLISDSEFFNTLLLTMDGTIMGVDYSCIEPFLSDNDLSMIRLGMKKPPDKISFDTAESFYRYISYQKFSL